LYLSTAHFTIKMEGEIRRSSSLDLGKSTRFDFSVDRNRNDSGCFEDFDMAVGGNHHDPVVTYWEEAVYQWSERARSVIAQEVVRMNELTQKRKRDLLKHDDRDKVHKAWKLNMKETMDLAQDLMKCVSYDILEEFGCEPAPSEDYRRMSEKQLGKIAEEESGDEAHKSVSSPHGNRVFIIRVDHRIRRVKPQKKRNAVKSPFTKAAPKSSRNKLSKNTMTFLLEELKELRKMVGMKKTGDTGKQFWGCNQCLSNKKAWPELGGTNQVDSVEDIFHDWVRMLSKTDIHLNSDINDVFWSISFDKAKVRTRRLSEVLDDMPFGDRPDIFADRCEILESDQRFAKKKPPPKSYWNIFQDWKHVLREPTPPLSEWEVLERKKNAQNVGKKKREEVEMKDPEDYFQDWKKNLDPRRRQMKKKRNLEQEDFLQVWRQIVFEGKKKLFFRHEHEQEDYFEDWRDNFNPKSHRQMKRESREVAQEDFFRDWRRNSVDVDGGKKAPKIGRKMRRSARDVDQEDFFRDWRHNFDLKVADKKKRFRSPSPEDHFEDWRFNFDLDGRHRRRSVDDLEEDELIIMASPYKKIKQDFHAKRRASGQSMAYKFGRAYQSMKRNFLIALGNDKLKDNFDFWTSESTVQSLINSRKEFCQLRFEMRKQRQVNRELNEVIAPESWFEDWRWNIDNVDEKLYSRRRMSDPVTTSPEKIFSDWRRISLDQQTVPSDTFAQWMQNMKERVVAKHRRPKQQPQRQTMEMKEKLSPTTTTTKSTTKFGGVLTLNLAPVTFPSGDKKKSLKLPQMGKPRADKQSMRLITKCHAKQPNVRGRN
jgi:hypothetical protein